MTLELKHLSPYLPYGLKIKYSDKEEIYTLEGLSYPYKTNRKAYLQGVIRLENTTKISSHIFNVEHPEKLAKPILRPLNDLVKEIEHKGEKFVPLETLFEFINPNRFRSTKDPIPKNKKIWIEDPGECYFLECGKGWDLFQFAYMTGAFMLKVDGSGYVSFCIDQVGLFNKLYEWHFDIFGLIDKGLAIDINSLTNK